MAHLRKRHISAVLQKYLSYWPVVGVLGPRQCGKTTLFHRLIASENAISLDDRSFLDEIAISPKAFLSKYPTPLLIDEAQKAPQIFDAIKLLVDRNRKPGSYLLTGSSQFSAKIGIRESLTGRIGTLFLFPFTLAEAHQLELDVDRLKPNHQKRPRFKIEDFSKQLLRGGLPVPLFGRDTEMRKSYFKEWLETTVYRDVPRVFGKNYDPDFAWAVLEKCGKVMKEGELVTVQNFKYSSRKVGRYLEAFEMLFLLRKLRCHEEGIGRDAWMMTDVGLANHLMGHEGGEGVLLSQVRIQAYNELLANLHYAGESVHPVYYKSARGTPVDLVWNEFAVKFSVRPYSQLAYDEKALEGCIKKLKLKGGFLMTPFDGQSDFKSKIKTVPWTHFS